MANNANRVNNASNANNATHANTANNTHRANMANNGKSSRYLCIVVDRIADGMEGPWGANAA